MKGNGDSMAEQGWWQTAFPSYLGIGTGILIFATSYFAGASWQAVALRTIIAGLGMWGIGKLTGAVVKVIFSQAGIDEDMPQNLGQNIDVRLEPEQWTNGQIDNNLQQTLMDDPERLDNLAKKMGAA